MKKNRKYFAVLGNLPKDFPWDYGKETARTERYLGDMDRIAQKAIADGYKYFITQHKEGVCADFDKTLCKYGMEKKLSLSILGFNAEPYEDFSNEIIDKSDFICFFWNNRKNGVSKAIEYAKKSGKRFEIYYL